MVASLVALASLLVSAVKQFAIYEKIITQLFSHYMLHKYLPKPQVCLLTIGWLVQPIAAHSQT
ncbi:hypothetical protein [Anabaena subtropica]|uniref:Secreted protein n=1 Tax=Anabaena subtropica FACHB-260 TaxID=2692884 RepID=A0ABR8CNF3_9NOST|nr:hypothetical protein [Anabaena subtropica]MBD2343968.1 hypothetical protein [Anabaena subtropica FACHB-260]